MAGTENKRETPREFWNRMWAGGGRLDLDFWKKVSPEIKALVASLSPDEHPDVVDVGCGLGRNTIAFAEAGFNVTATDISDEALAHMQRWADEKGLNVKTKVCNYYDDVFDADSFDVALGVNVLYHGTFEQFKQSARNVRKWLRPGGVFHFSCPSIEDEEFTRGEKIGHHLIELAPGHLHYHVDEPELDELVEGFTDVQIEKSEYTWDNRGREQFSSRFNVTARV